MAYFQHVETRLDGSLTYVSAVTDLALVTVGGVTRLYAVTAQGGGVSVRSLDAGMAVLGSVAHPASAGLAASPQLTPMTVAGQSLLAVAGLWDTGLRGYALSSAGVPGTQRLYASGSTEAYSAFESVQIGARTFIVTAGLGGTGLISREVTATGALSSGSQITVGAAEQGVGIGAMAQATVGTGRLILAVSAFDNRLLSFRMSDSGVLTAGASLGANEGLGIAAPCVVETVQMAGSTYALVGSAGSDTISVVRLGADGGMTVTDNAMDSLDTRFQGIGALEVIVVNGRVYLVAGGGDDGLSLLALLPTGRLLHLETIADTAQTALSNISALTARWTGSAIELFTAGRAEPGIGRFTLAVGTPAPMILGGAGNETLTGGAGADLIDGAAGADLIAGGAGDDIVIDGSGRDTLTGGAGADFFVLVSDGTPDEVRDFRLAEDRLDLSAWGMLYDIRQVLITATATGAVLQFGTEVLTLVTDTGTSLAATALTTAHILNLQHAPTALAAPPPPEPVGPITGTAGADSLTGSAMADTILGLGGNDGLSGGAGADRIEAGDGDDQAFGGAGNDTLDGGAGHDALTGGDDDDLLTGGVGDDTLTGEAGADNLSGGNNNDALFGGAGDDTLDGGDGNDVLWGGDGTDLLQAGIGDDSLYGEAGNDSLEGGDWADQIYCGSGTDTADGGNASDRLWGGDGADVLRGGNFHDSVWGDAGDDSVDGGWGDDALFGGTGVDSVFGGEGNDRLDGGSDADVLWGGAGADTFVVVAGGGADWIGDFTLGVDKLDVTGWGPLFSGHQLGFEATATGAILRYGAETLTVVSTTGAPLSRGEMVANGAFVAWSGLHGPTAGLVEITGTAAADLLTGTAGSDLLQGAGDNDTLRGLGGNDFLIGSDGQDALDGGDGIDTASYLGSVGNLLVDLLLPASNIARALGDSYVGIENLYGSQGRDNLRGDLGDNILDAGSNIDFLYGRRGNDTLIGGIGDDVLLGGVGADLLIGGPNKDRAQYSASVDAMVIDLAMPERNTGEAAGDQFDGIEDLAGGYAADSISGNAFNNGLYGREGADQLFGREGNDYLNGGAHADTLDGGAGNDTLRGGTQGDTFVFNAGRDVVEDFNVSLGDRIGIERTLLDGLALTGSELAQMAGLSGSVVLFDFGDGHTLTLTGQTGMAGLADALFSY